MPYDCLHFFKTILNHQSDLFIITDDMPLEGSYYDGGRDMSSTPTPRITSEKPTLHEILIAEKLDFEAKVQRATRRKKWLKGTCFSL